jgi:Fe2+ or Zn2+ uptake regulation protein
MKQRPRKRTTQQLQVVYEAVSQFQTHPSAEDVYQQARRILPRIGLGTVYRNLQRLVDENKIGTVFPDEHGVRYDPIITNHAHFICQQCGQITDVFLKQLLLGIDFSTLVRSGRTIATHSVVVKGWCPTCSTEDRRQASVGNGCPSP